jgi:hypothetical protein
MTDDAEAKIIEQDTNLDVYCYLTDEDNLKMLYQALRIPAPEVRTEPEGLARSKVEWLLTGVG